MPWIERETVECQIRDLPFDDEGKLAIIDPSKIKVFVPGFVNAVDIGAWCYSRRRRACRDTSSKRFGIIEVDFSSFRKTRKPFVLGYLEYLQAHLQLGKAEQSLKTSVGQFQNFVTWCDENRVQGLDSKKDFRNGYERFAEHLMHLVRSSEMNINTAAALQLVITTAVKHIYGDPYGDLLRGIRRFRKSIAATVVTERPDDEVAKATLEIYLSIFHQMTDFVLNFELFPKKIVLNTGDFWFFPNSMPILGASQAKNLKTLHSRFTAYDYENGKIRDIEDIVALKKSMKHWNVKMARGARNRGLLLIKNANRKRFHHRRVLAATMALQSFVLMFSANTAMGLGQISALEWEDEILSVEKDKQGFKTVKCRAGGKVVAFYITSIFLELFRKYLKLRRFVLEAFNHKSSKYLFFGVNGGEIRQLGLNLSTDFHSRLARSFDFPYKVTTRMWRAYKSDWLIKNTDISTTAMVLQNTPATVMKHYAEGSESQASDEMSRFFSRYKDRVIISGSAESVRTSVGQCLDSEKPTQNCSKPEGCLFCEEYRVHADEMDVRKLLSLEYMIQITRSLSESQEQHDHLFGAVKERINAVIGEIRDSKKMHSKQIEVIRGEVFNFEKLDGYWLNKLKLLETLELI